MKNMKIVDIVVTLVFVAALIVIYFFWGCTWDLYATILAVVIAIVAGVVTYKQHKRLKELENETEQNK